MGKKKKGIMEISTVAVSGGTVPDSHTLILAGPHGTKQVKKIQWYTDEDSGKVWWEEIAKEPEQVKQRIDHPKDTIVL